MDSGARLGNGIHMHTRMLVTPGKPSMYNCMHDRSRSSWHALMMNTGQYEVETRKQHKRTPRVAGQLCCDVNSG